jgi:hypothetical protein
MSKKVEIHHIIAKADSRASIARNILLKYTFLDDSRNLVAMKYELHKRLHTLAYYTAVNVWISTWDIGGQSSFFTGLSIANSILFSMNLAIPL